MLRSLPIGRDNSGQSGQHRKHWGCGVPSVFCRLEQTRDKKLTTRLRIEVDFQYSPQATNVMVARKAARKCLCLNVAASGGTSSSSPGGGYANRPKRRRRPWRSRQNRIAVGNWKRDSTASRTIARTHQSPSRSLAAPISMIIASTQGHRLRRIRGGKCHPPPRRSHGR